MKRNGTLKFFGTRFFSWFTFENFEIYKKNATSKTAKPVASPVTTFRLPSTVVHCSIVIHYYGAKVHATHLEKTY